MKMITKIDYIVLPTTPLDGLSRVSATRQSKGSPGARGVKLKDGRKDPTLYYTNIGGERVICVRMKWTNLH